MRDDRGYRQQYTAGRQLNRRRVRSWYPYKETEARGLRSGTSVGVLLLPVGLTPRPYHGLPWSYSGRVWIRRELLLLRLLRQCSRSRRRDRLIRVRLIGVRVRRRAGRNVHRNLRAEDLPIGSDSRAREGLLHGTVRIHARRRHRPLIARLSVVIVGWRLNDGLHGRPAEGGRWHGRRGRWRPARCHDDHAVVLRCTGNVGRARRHDISRSGAQKDVEGLFLRHVD